MSYRIVEDAIIDTGLASLVLLLKFLGLTVDPEQIKHQYSIAAPKADSKPKKAAEAATIVAWLMDLIVSFGGQQEAAKELRETVLKGQKIKSLQPAPDGVGMAVVEW